MDPANQQPQQPPQQQQQQQPEVLEPFITEDKRCMSNTWNQSPGPTAGNVCPKYSCYGCCDENEAMKHFASGNAYGHYGPYQFYGCSSDGKIDTTGSGGLSEQCHTFIQNNHCLSACSPNVYLWFAKTGNSRHDDHLHGMKTCTSFCTDFYNSCKDEHICFNQDGLAEYFTDYLSGQLSEEKDYKIFHCEGNYKCQKIQDSLIAKPLDLSSMTSLGLSSNLRTDSQSRNEVENFCSKFSFGMFDMEKETDHVCIDPRDENSIITAVKAREEVYNLSNPGNKRSFPVSQDCPTGLSQAAIIGISVGVTAGLLLIATLVFFICCRKKEEKDDEYTLGTQAQPEADYDPSSRASQK